MGRVDEGSHLQRPCLSLLPFSTFCNRFCPQYASSIFDKFRHFYEFAPNSSSRPGGWKSGLNESLEAALMWKHKGLPPGAVLHFCFAGTTTAPLSSAWKKAFFPFHLAAWPSSSACHQCRAINTGKPFVRCPACLPAIIMKPTDPGQVCKGEVLLVYIHPCLVQASNSGNSQKQKTMHQGSSQPGCHWVCLFTSL